MTAVERVKEFNPDMFCALGDLLGPEGNAYVIMGRVQRAFKANGIPHELHEAWFDEAKQGDYGQMLERVLATFDTDKKAKRQAKKIIRTYADGRGE